MQIKKYPHAVLENYSKILVLLGLVLSLFLVYEVIQLKSYPAPVKNLTGTVVSLDDIEQIVEFTPIEIEVKKPVKVVVPDKILIVDDEIEVDEIIIESTETDESEGVVVDVNKEVVELEEEEEVEEDVPFMVIEKVPIYPGCVGDNNELRSCFSAKLTKFISKNFNAELGTDLGLTPGTIQRIFVLFRIDKNGNISDIQARAPHKKLQAEAIRVIKLIPKMTPGKQRGRPVAVKYALPITFRIE